MTRDGEDVLSRSDAGQNAADTLDCAGASIIGMISRVLTYSTNVNRAGFHTREPNRIPTLALELRQLTWQSHHANRPSPFDSPLSPRTRPSPSD